MTVTTGRMEAALEALLGHEPSSDELAKVYRVKDVLGLADHDAIWTVLLALGYYGTLYEEIPEKIRAASLDIIAQQRMMLEPAARAVETQMAGTIERKSAETVARIVEETLRGAKAIGTDARRRLTVLAIGLSLSVAAVLVGLVGWGAYSAGRAERNGELAWLDSAEGRAARAFAKLNNVAAMLECGPPLTHQQGKDGGYCVPYDGAAKQVRMWRVE